MSKINVIQGGLKYQQVAQNLHNLQYIKQERFQEGFQNQELNNDQQNALVLSSEQEILKLLEQFNDDAIESYFDQQNKNNERHQQISQGLLPKIGLQFLPPVREDYVQSLDQLQPATSNNNNSKEQNISQQNILNQFQNQVNQIQQAYQSNNQTQGQQNLPQDFQNIGQFQADNILDQNKFSNSQAKQKKNKSQEGQKIVSHSHIEKFRRDRINSLIDELRNLVPSLSQECFDLSEKRPKHIVLQDAIQHIKNLTNKDNGQQDNISNSKRLDTSWNLYKRSSSPQSSDTQDALKGVEVEVEQVSDGYFEVKVKSKDSKGLFVEVANVLKQMPLKILQAKALTSQDLVEDNFEVLLNENSKMGCQEIQQTILQGFKGKGTAITQDPSNTQFKRQRLNN